LNSESLCFSGWFGLLWQLLCAFRHGSALGVDADPRKPVVGYGPYRMATVECRCYAIEEEEYRCYCGRVAFASPEFLSLMEGFLGMASVCLALAVWRFYNKSLGRLCHVKHASAWGSSHRVPCCQACLRMGEWLPQDCCELTRWKRLSAPPWDIPLLRAGWFL
jgi:hypothetical protein